MRRVTWSVMAPVLRMHTEAEQYRASCQGWDICAKMPFSLISRCAPRRKTFQVNLIHLMTPLTPNANDLFSTSSCPSSRITPTSKYDRWFGRVVTAQSTQHSQYSRQLTQGHAQVYLWLWFGHWQIRCDWFIIKWHLPWPHLYRPSSWKVYRRNVYQASLLYTCGQSRNSKSLNYKLRIHTWCIQDVNQVN